MNIHPIPAFEDNYIWLFHAPGSRNAYVVDPGDVAAVESALTEMNLSLAGILVTHHHFDHTGGIAQLTANRYIPVIGSTTSRCELITHPVSEDDCITLDDGMVFRVIEVPGHTLDHIAFYSDKSKALFCGDTLFMAGCGRLFEGTPEQMLESLEKLAALPPDTQVYCTHEYTLSNFKFAQAVEPDNRAIETAIAKAQKQRNNQQPTLPSTIAAELAHNPFLRSSVSDVAEAAARRLNTSDELSKTDVFAAIRSWKDVF